MSVNRFTAEQVDCGVTLCHQLVYSKADVHVTLHNEMRFIPFHCVLSVETLAVSQETSMKTALCPLSSLSYSSSFRSLSLLVFSPFVINLT